MKRHYAETVKAISMAIAQGSNGSIEIGQLMLSSMQSFDLIQDFQNNDTARHTAIGINAAGAIIPHEQLDPQTAKYYIMLDKQADGSLLYSVSIEQMFSSSESFPVSQAAELSRDEFYIECERVWRTDMLHSLRSIHGSCDLLGDECNKYLREGMNRDSFRGLLLAFTNQIKQFHLGAPKERAAMIESLDPSYPAINQALRTVLTELERVMRQFNQHTAREPNYAFQLGQLCNFMKYFEPERSDEIEAAELSVRAAAAKVSQDNQQDSERDSARRSGGNLQRNEDLPYYPDDLRAFLHRSTIEEPHLILPEITMIDASTIARLARDPGYNCVNLCLLHLQQLEAYYNALSAIIREVKTLQTIMFMLAPNQPSRLMALLGFRDQLEEATQAAFAENEREINQLMSEIRQDYALLFPEGGPTKLAVFIAQLERTAAPGGHGNVLLSQVRGNTDALIDTLARYNITNDQFNNFVGKVNQLRERIAREYGPACDIPSLAELRTQQIDAVNTAGKRAVVAYFCDREKLSVTPSPNIHSIYRELGDIQQRATSEQTALATKSGIPAAVRANLIKVAPGNEARLNHTMRALTERAASSAASSSVSAPASVLARSMASVTGGPVPPQREDTVPHAEKGASLGARFKRRLPGAGKNK